MRHFPLNDRPRNSCNRWYAAIAAVISIVSAVGLGGCPMRRESPPQPPAHAPDLATPIGADTAARAALFSIYYDALHERHALPSPNRERYPPEDVVAAANLLAADPDAVSWKRMAIAKLVGSSQPGPTPNQWTPESFRDALIALHAPLDKISQAWLAQVGDSAKWRLKDANAADVSLALEDAAWTAMNASDSPCQGNVAPVCSRPISTQAAAACPRWATSYSTSNTPGDVRIGMVPSLLGDVRPRVLHPIVPGERLQLDLPNHRRSTKMHRAIGYCEHGVAGARSVCGGTRDLHPTQIEFTNLLKIGAAPQAGDGYAMSYAFCKGIDSSICGAQGGLSVDCGCIDDQDDGSGTGNTTLYGVKYIRFCDPDLDNWTVVRVARDGR